MINFIISASVILALFASTLGWGRPVAKFFFRGVINTPAFSATLGLACWIFLGGILNALRVAYPAALGSIFLAGLCVSCLFLYLTIRNTRSLADFLIPLRFGLLAPRFTLTFLTASSSPLLILAAVVFLIATLMPTSAFNFHDDFHMYMVRPIRMLHTGTLGGDPFDLLGIDSLGAQSFLQTFVLIHLPLDYLNGFDVIFSFMLSGFLLIELGRKLGVSWQFLITSLLLLIFINPQYVNISSLYSSTLMILALIFSVCLPTTPKEATDIRFTLRHSALMALLLSSLIALKATFVIFAGLFFALYVTLSISYTHKKAQSAIAAAVTALISTILLIPWVVVSFKNYKTVIQIHSQHSAYQALDAGRSPFTAGDFTQIFSLGELFYGGSYLNYNLIVVVMAIAGFMSARLLRRNKDQVQVRQLISVASACGAGIGSYWANAQLFDPETAVRYSCPVLLAVLPASVLIVGKCCLTPRGGALQTASQAPAIMRARVMSVLLLGILIASFANVLIDRGKHAFVTRTIVSFPFDESYIAYNQFVLSEQAQNRLLNIQSVTEKGSTILALVSSPFLLDFARNRILAASDWGLTAPWLDGAFGGGRKTIEKYLKDEGVRYAMWEYNGWGMRADQTLRKYLKAPFPQFRKMAANALSLRETLSSVGNTSRVIYNDGQLVVFDFGAQGHGDSRGD